MRFAELFKRLLPGGTPPSENDTTRRDFLRKTGAAVSYGALGPSVKNLEFLFGEIRLIGDPVERVRAMVQWTLQLEDVIELATKDMQLLNDPIGFARVMRKQDASLTKEDIAQMYEAVVDDKMTTLNQLQTLLGQSDVPINISTYRNHLLHTKQVVRVTENGGMLHPKTLTTWMESQNDLVCALTNKKELFTQWMAKTRTGLVQRMPKAIKYVDRGLARQKEAQMWRVEQENLHKQQQGKAKRQEAERARRAQQQKLEQQLAKDEAYYVGQRSKQDELIYAAAELDGQVKLCAKPDGKSFELTLMRNLTAGGEMETPEAYKARAQAAAKLLTQSFSDKKVIVEKADYARGRLMLVAQQDDANAAYTALKDMAAQDNAQHRGAA